jgi:Rap/ran-GAP
VIVFKEGDQPYDPNCLKSEFNRILAFSPISLSPPSLTIFLALFLTLSSCSRFSLLASSLFLPYSLPTHHFSPRRNADIFAVVSKIKKAGDSKTYYHVSIACKEGVPTFKPDLPTNAIFEKGELFRDFLLCKCMCPHPSSLLYVGCVCVGACVCWLFGCLFFEFCRFCVLCRRFCVSCFALRVSCLVLSFCRVVFCSFVFCSLYLYFIVCLLSLYYLA